jgi:hypothetical protein
MKIIMIYMYVAVVGGFRRFGFVLDLDLSRWWHRGMREIVN